MPNQQKDQEDRSPFAKCSVGLFYHSLTGCASGSLERLYGQRRTEKGYSVVKPRNPNSRTRTINRTWRLSAT